MNTNTNSITITLTETQLMQIQQLLETRSGKTIEEQVADSLRHGLDNDVYRQERNRRVNQERKELELRVRELESMLAK